MKRILNLENNDGYPVLRLETGSGSDGKVVNIHVEQYDENKPYVALSHVSSTLVRTSGVINSHRRFGPMA